MKRISQEPDVGSSAQTVPRQFGAIAICKGFITQGQLEDGLDMQRQITESGKRHQLLGLVMIEMGMLSNAQLVDVLKQIEADSGRHHD